MAKGKRPDWRVRQVVFETTVQDGAARFSVPEDIRRVLRLKRGESMKMSIETDSGVKIPLKTKAFTSGSEILERGLKPGQKIDVRISRALD